MTTVKPVCECGHPRVMHSRSNGWCRYKGCPCRSYSRNVIKPSFSDDGKRKHGVKVFDAAQARMKLETMQFQLKSLVSSHDQQLTVIRSRLNGVISMLEDGRRGDALHELRALAREPGKMKLKPVEPEQPGAA